MTSLVSPRKLREFISKIFKRTPTKIQNVTCDSPEPQQSYVNHADKSIDNDQQDVKHSTYPTIDERANDEDRKEDEDRKNDIDRKDDVCRCATNKWSETLTICRHSTTDKLSYEYTLKDESSENKMVDSVEISVSRSANRTSKSKKNNRITPYNLRPRRKLTYIDV